MFVRDFPTNESTKVCLEAVAHGHAGNGPKVALLAHSQPNIVRRVELAGPFNAGQGSFGYAIEEGIVIGAVEAEDGFQHLLLLCWSDRRKNP